MTTPKIFSVTLLLLTSILGAGPVDAADTETGDR